ncbi:lytic transglycosylase domain-containing protein [Spirillospora albida]|uniref:lytic transglycosylase domain-containing protein n=1 Tax=Spirillospora albida TaxID=58123 RepID=UPI0006921189|nr:lytic transglycosylase domain-containing protein [Spirillospora albida]
MTAISEIAARIAQIQALSRPQAAATATSAAASGTKFAEVLNSVQNTTAGSAQAATGTAPAAGTTASGKLAGVPYANLFTAAAAKHGVPAALLAAVAKTESSFDPDVVSHAGARGLMQFMPGTARGLGIDPSDPAEAVDGAARLLKRLIGKFDSLPLALAGYNAGEGAVANYGGIPPYAETQAYVRKVQAAMKSYGG